ncbi:hypothetical protein WJX77_005921 [Trebouxia sp. C0004]
MLNTESRKRFLNVAMWIGLLKAALLRIQHLSNAQAGGIMSLSSKEMSALVVGCLVTQLQVQCCTRLTPHSV